MTPVERLRGEWLVESWFMKEHRWQWYLRAANFKKNDERAVVPVMTISYEWNAQVSLDIFLFVKNTHDTTGGLGVGGRAGGCPIFPSMWFSLELKIPQYEKSSKKVSFLD